MISTWKDSHAAPVGSFSLPSLASMEAASPTSLTRVPDGCAESQLTVLQCYLGLRIVSPRIVSPRLMLLDTISYKHTGTSTSLQSENSRYKHSSSTGSLGYKSSIQIPSHTKEYCLSFSAPHACPQSAPQVGATPFIQSSKHRDFPKFPTFIPVYAIVYSVASWYRSMRQLADQA